ncbi:MAG: methyltransferase domain-containing protein [Chloroflexi bacterium]|nr:methyltransferase domain-containing protein [Chloroflexota bacterium]
MTDEPNLARGSRERFSAVYDRPQTQADLAVEREVFDANEGICGFTTVAQADVLATRLALRPGMRLLDIGAGRGWPGLYLARISGCQAVLIDLPLPALREGMQRAHRHRLQKRSSFLTASGTHPPFRAKAFDAIVHTDVL